MNDDDDLQDLPLLDERARAASRGLHDHVRRHLLVDDALQTVPTSRRPAAGRIAALAAVAALFVGVVAVTNTRTGQDDRDREAVHTGVLRPLGPRDGKDSIRLPVTVSPGEGLRDGDTVTVSATGFVPGENVGIVQCAREAGGEVREERAGADACNIAAYIGATADDAGAITGSFTVRRLLTTPATGTVDCAAEADRCLIGVGAIADYDRSGGKPIRFATDVEPVAIPTASVTPATELHDGDLVEVVVDGLRPNEVVQLEVCSTDPLSCWQTGAEIVQEGAEEGGTMRVRGLQADGSGHAQGTVPVWRFLPGPDASTYVDCALSPCQLRILGESSPPTLALGFAPGGPTPRPPVLAVDRTTGLRPGDELVVEGSGFRDDVALSLSLCIVDLSHPDSGYLGCWGSGPSIEPGADGAFTTTFEIDAELGLPPEDLGRCDPTTCTTAGGEVVRPTCDGVEQRCLIVGEVYSQSDGRLPLRPEFPPVPVEVRFA